MAIEIPITVLTPISGSTIPVNGKVSGTEITYTAWQLNDAAAFSFRIPAGWTSASTLKLRIQESTPGQSLKHKWQAVVILVRPGTHTITVATVTETFSTEYTSSGTASMYTVRDLVISDGNLIDTTPILTGDLISVKLSRIAASASEDGNPIKILDLIAYAAGAEASANNDCLGDVGQIITEVLDLFNDARQGALTATIVLSWINACQRKLAKAGLFQASAYKDVTGGQGTYDLTADSNFAGIIKPHAVFFYAQSKLWALQELSTLIEYYEKIARAQTGQMAAFYYFSAGTISLAPVPNTSITNGMLIPYHLNPAARGCTSSYALYQHSSVHVDCYKHFALWQAYDRDKTNPSAPALASKYQMLFQQDFTALIAAGRPATIRTRPHGNQY